MNHFAKLNPPLLWKHFAEFTTIARPSKQEDKMRAYISAWAQRHGFRAKTDAAGNLCVVVPASSGRENAATVILQGHMDMVCVRANQNSPYDPAQGNIRIVRTAKAGEEFVEAEDGEWIKADNTTLGADNGIGVAASRHRQVIGIVGWNQRLPSPRQKVRAA
jgi:dipeptidase D